MTAARRRLVLASASPARRRLLEAAGLDPEVIVSTVDETDVAQTDTREVVLILARRKAREVAGRAGDALVVGCDSLLDLEGTAHGKAGSAAEARERWLGMRGRKGTLCTGHYVIDTRSGAEASAVGTTVVSFGWPSDVEIDAYVATGEPETVAGAFTLDGLAAPFIDGIDGDAGNVIGLSLPLLRGLLSELGTGITDLWR